MTKTRIVEIADEPEEPDDAVTGSTKEVPVFVPSRPVVLTGVQVSFRTIVWLTLRVVVALVLIGLALWALVALLALVGLGGIAGLTRHG